MFGMGIYIIPDVLFGIVALARRFAEFFKHCCFCVSMVDVVVVYISMAVVAIYLQAPPSY